MLSGGAVLSAGLLMLQGIPMFAALCTIAALSPMVPWILVGAGVLIILLAILRIVFHLILLGVVQYVNDRIPVQ